MDACSHSNDDWGVVARLSMTIADTWVTGELLLVSRMPNDEAAMLHSPY
jgi:hypothetical protein